MVTEKRLKILDFGIARMTGFDNRLTRTGFAFGSPMYMSPEQLLGQPLDGRSDLYSLGILAYALIAGREPFDGREPGGPRPQAPAEEIPDIRQFRPGLPAPWKALLARLLAKEPANRYASAQEVLAAAARLLPGAVENRNAPQAALTGAGSVRACGTLLTSFYGGDDHAFLASRS